MAGLSLLGACAPSPNADVPDLRDARQRLVSLNPCLDAMLVEIAAPDQVLALSHYSFDPKSSSIPQTVAGDFASTGGTAEEVLALNPDMVLASTFLAPATGEAMRDLDVRFRTFPSPATVEDSLVQVRYVGALAGQESASGALAQRIERAVQANAAPLGHHPISTVLWQPGEIVPGEQALVSELMRKAGFSSHSTAIGLGQADYLPLETLLANPPELLLIAGNARGQSHPALAKLHGTRVETLDPSLLYCGGPTIIRAMERLAEIRERMRAGTHWDAGA